MQLKGLRHSGVILELKVHREKYKSISDTLSKMMSARKKGINNEYRISLTKRPRPNKCPSPNKCLPPISLCRKIAVTTQIPYCKLYDNANK